jgi:hypothetical protein
MLRRDIIGLFSADLKNYSRNFNKLGDEHTGAEISNFDVYAYMAYL